MKKDTCNIFKTSCVKNLKKIWFHYVHYILFSFNYAYDEIFQFMKLQIFIQIIYLFLIEILAVLEIKISYLHKRKRPLDEMCHQQSLRIQYAFFVISW